MIFVVDETNISVVENSNSVNSSKGLLLDTFVKQRLVYGRIVL